MQKPTIGRIVLFRETDGVYYSAIIVSVGIPDKEDSWVNLRVFANTTGDLPWKTSVPKNSNTLGQNTYSWEWPTTVFSVPAATPAVLTAAPSETAIASAATASVEPTV